MEAKRTILNSFLAPRSIIPSVKEEGEEEESNSSLDLEQLDQYFATQQEPQGRDGIKIIGTAEERPSDDEDDPFGSPDFDKMSDTPLIKTF
jgi:hypothetical protein